MSNKIQRATDTRHIERLTNSNFVMWKSTMRNMLRSIRAYEIVSGGVDVTKLGNDVDYTDLVYLAASYISALVSPSLQWLVDDGTDDMLPDAMWNRILNHFAPITSSNRFELKIQFYSLTMDDDEEMDHFIQRIDSLAMRVNHCVARTGHHVRPTAIPIRGDVKAEKKEDDSRSEIPRLTTVSPPVAFMPGAICDDDRLAVLLHSVKRHHSSYYATLVSSEMSYSNTCRYVIEHCVRAPRARSDEAVRTAVEQDVKQPKPNKKKCSFCKRLGHTVDKC